MRFFVNKEMYAASRTLFNSTSFSCPICRNEGFVNYDKYATANIDFSLVECEQCQERIAVIDKPALDINELIRMRFEDNEAIKI